MDDTQQSRASDAAATRKRRSSILKSQRPARTPFSELEFNVATPTDTAKSRRVSFSRRTGVAEFVTNEATTTWKNFYEEHNKSLESSGNDSDMNSAKQPVGHLGKRIFDLQFEEVEATDFIGSINPVLGTSTSMSNVNFTEQIASLEGTVECKLTAPQSNFDLSSLPDHQSKIFGNDFTVGGCEMSGRIDVNFSAINQIGEKDDLDEIQRDLERASNVMCQGPSDRHNISEYIEVDLNMTHVVNNNECDMSITDTIHSPKVQDVSKSISIDKKVSLSNEKDWATDKENIAINPYAAPREDNFAVNEEPNQVLVFDGKRLTIQTEQPDKDYRKTITPNAFITPQRKTIVLNTNDDLPNFLEEANSKSEVELKTSVIYNDFELSMTVPVNKVDIVPKRKTIHDNTGNISITQALPSNIISGTSGKRRTIVYEDDACDISMTQALPSKIIAQKESTERRRTVIYENDTGNISITQSLPTNIFANNQIQNEKRKTIVFDDDKNDISMTQALPSNLILEQKVPEKRKTIVFNNDDGNISITQALPANIMLESQSQEKRTIIYDDNIDVSVTQAAPSNLILTENPDPIKGSRTVFENDFGDLSITQALPQNIIVGKTETNKTQIFDANISMTQVLPTNIIAKQANANRTVVYEDDTGNISITQAIPTNLIPALVNQKVSVDEEDVIPPSFNKATINKRRTIIFDNAEADISVTQTIYQNIIIPEAANVIIPEAGYSNQNRSKGRTVLYDDDKCDISLAQSVPANVFLLSGIESNYNQDVLKADIEKQIAEDIIPDSQDLEEIVEKHISNDILDSRNNAVTKEKRRTIVFTNDDNDAEMSITEAIPKVKHLLVEFNKRNTIHFDQESGNLSMTKPIPADLIAIDSHLLKKSVNKLLELSGNDPVANQNQDLLVYQAVTKNSLPRLSRSAQGDLEKEITVDRKSNDTVLKTNDSDQKLIELPNLKDRSANQSITSQINNDESESEVQVDKDQTMNAPEEMEVDNQDVCREYIDVNQKSFNVEENVDPDKHPQIVAPTRDKTALKDLMNMSSESVVYESFNVEENISPDKQPQVVARTHVGTALKDLLDMSSESVVCDKSIFANSEEMPLEPLAKDDSFVNDRQSSIREICIETQTEIEKLSDEINNVPEIKEHTSLSVEYKEPEMLENLEEKVEELSTEVKKQPSSPLRQNSATYTEDAVEKNSERSYRKSIKDVNDTRELLDLISDFTDKTVPFCDNDMDTTAKNSSVAVENKTLHEQATSEEEEDKIDSENLIESHRPRKSSSDNRESLEPVRLSYESRKKSLEHKRYSIDNKRESYESKRLSFAPNRLSIVISREDLINNISMAQAMLQKSRLELDESSLTDDTQDTSPEDDSTSNVSKKSPRLSNEVIKTLNFDDESVSDNSDHRFDKRSPLKKTVFGESSYMKEPKSKVIPTYLKDVTDNIKELMSDLVKPLADTLPFERIDSKKLRQNASIASTQIQANLATSSQIDIGDSEFETDVDTPCLHKAIKRNTVGFSVPISDPEYIIHNHPPCATEMATPGQVLIFDHANPLNNILIGPLDNKAHKYNPVPCESTETLRRSDHSVSIQVSIDSKADVASETSSVAIETESDNYLDRITTQYHVETGLSYAKGDEQIESKTLNKTYKEQSDVNLTEVKDSEVNTVIAMKSNKELLETSSALTLVEEPMTTKLESPMETDDKDVPETDKVDLNIADSETSTMIREVEAKLERDEDMTDVAKSKKRVYHPATPNKGEVTKVEITPKPSTKMQKLSDSPATKTSPEIRKMKSPKKPIDKTDLLTVQELITKYNTKELDKISDKMLDSDLLENYELKSESTMSEDLEANLEIATSFTSSENQRSISTASQSTSSSLQSNKVGWRSPDKNGSSKRSLNGCDSGVNVVAKIDMLPFIGSHECEWESSSIDTWCFRLLHGRVRLSVRLAHRHDNATRTHVRADTRVTEVSVETVHHSKKNPVATLCVRFACETIRYMISRMKSDSIAKDIPPLLRRCAAIVRLAVRWGRAMHDAKLHLAYSLDNDGHLTLKVANIPLRSVWEVSTDLELVVEDARQAPWPRATNVRVTRVVSDVVINDEDVQRVLSRTPKDWGHSPRTLWKMFRYLKHKTRDDDLLLGA